jgi:RNA polymerase sigma-70 factor, ECF subfamily
VTFGGQFRPISNSELTSVGVFGSVAAYYFTLFVQPGGSMDSISLEHLVRRCQQAAPDDTAAFEMLVAAYKDRVYATAYRLMGNHHEAEDQAQEVFLKIYRRIRQLDEPLTLTSWIYRITTNTCFDALNKQKRRPPTTPLDPYDAEGNEQPHYADERAPKPEETVLHHELRECLEATLASLDTTGRAVLVLRDIEERPYQEIAETLQLGLSAAKMRIHRARLAFQQLLDKICPDVRGGGSGAALS